MAPRGRTLDLWVGDRERSDRASPSESPVGPVGQGTVGQGRGKGHPGSRCSPGQGGLAQELLLVGGGADDLAGGPRGTERGGGLGLQGLDRLEEGRGLSRTCGKINRRVSGGWGGGRGWNPGSPWKSQWDGAQKVSHTSRSVADNQQTPSIGHIHAEKRLQEPKTDPIGFQTDPSRPPARRTGRRIRPKGEGRPLAAAEDPFPTGGTTTDHN